MVQIMKTAEKVTMPAVKNPEDGVLILYAGLAVLTWGLIFLLVIIEKRGDRKHRGRGIRRE